MGYFRLALRFPLQANIGFQVDHKAVRPFSQRFAYPRYSPIAKGRQRPQSLYGILRFISPRPADLPGWLQLDTIQSSLASRGSVPSPDIPDLPDRHIKESARTSQTAYADELSEADITKSVLADERSEHDIDLEARQHGVDVMPKWPPR